MEEHTSGKRVAPGGGMGTVQKRVIIISCALVAALAAIYLALCAYVSVSGTILPRVTYQGVELGGMTFSQAKSTLSSASQSRFGDVEATLTYPTSDGKEASSTFPGSLVSFDAVAVATSADSYSRGGSFFTYGLRLLTTLATGYEPDIPLAFTNQDSATAIADEIRAAIERELSETTYAIDGDRLVFRLGVSGMHANADRILLLIQEAFSAGGNALNIAVEPVVDPLPFPDLDTIYAEVYTEAASAALDPETKDIIPAVVGMDFDAAKADQLLKEAAEGSDCAVPLTLTQPEISTEQLVASLFRDVLGQATSRVGGSANRKYNVKLSAQACNEQILLPGEIFAYNQTTGSRSAAKGYLPAPAYVGGLSVDELGGGICQTSSTLYYATLNANMKIVERQNHMYAVGYVPDGMDATVYYGSLDFRFENNTPYPLKIVTESYDKGGSRYLTVKIMGTQTSDTYVKMTNKEISSIAPETVYKADDTVPVGAQPKPDPQSTAYRGRKVEAYRNVYAADGTLISSTLESVNNYKKRDRVLLVNPAELASYQATGQPPAAAIPSATPAPVVSPDAPVMPTPTVTPPVETIPVVTPTPPPAEAVPTPSPTQDNGIPVLTPPPATVDGAEGST